jgi:prepilin signal peptidase PulO-like enzyme (type II secretory pathway)
MILIFLIGFGLILGSFVNALVWRLHEGRDWVRERSECTHCHHVLAAKDLVPVVSWLALRGKCRYCRAKIDDTPLAELVLPVLFVISYYAWPLTLHGVGLFQFVLWLLFLVAFLALAVYDLRWFILPDKIVYTLVLLAVLEVLVRVVFYHQGVDVLVQALLGAAVLSGLFYLLFTIYNGTWIGGGDVKLALVLGLLAGSGIRALLLLFAASTIGTLCLLPSLLMRKTKMKAQIPFGPFLIVGLLVVYLFGARIIDWYTQLLSVSV